MTTTPAPTDTIELPAGMAIVVPEGVDPLDGLTVSELDIASRQCRGDVFAIATGRPVPNPEAASKWKALGLIAWLWAKRRDPQSKLQPYLDLTGPQLHEVLGFHRLDPDELVPGSEVPAELENPTTPPPA